MPEYRIEWSIEVEADDPEAAARLALAIQKDPIEVSAALS